MNNLSLLFTGIVTLISISAVTPWQLFQSMCPYIGAQSPQCAFLQRATAAVTAATTTLPATTANTATIYNITIHITPTRLITTYIYAYTTYTIRIVKEHS